jgi:hypothetical protein
MVVRFHLAAAYHHFILFLWNVETSSAHGSLIGTLNMHEDEKGKAALIVKA